MSALTIGTLPVLDLGPVPERDDNHEQYVAGDGVDDAVVAYPDPDPDPDPETGSAALRVEGSRRRWCRRPCGPRRAADRHSGGDVGGGGARAVIESTWAKDFLVATVDLAGGRSTQAQRAGWTRPAPPTTGDTAVLRLE